MKGVAHRTQSYGSGDQYIRVTSRMMGLEPATFGVTAP